MRPFAGADEAKRIVQTYEHMLLRISLHYVRHREDAEDIVQEVFAKWAAARPSFSSAEHEKAWFIRVAMNRSSSHLRTARRWESLPAGDPPSPAGTPEGEGVLDEVRRLPEHYRAVIYLHYYEGYTLVEISRLLHRKLSTVQTWHQRAKAALKKRREGDGYVLGDI